MLKLTEPVKVYLACGSTDHPVLSRWGLFYAYGYIHVNVDPEIVIKAAELGNDLGAASMKVTEGFRTREEYYRIPGYENRPADAYLDNFHCRGEALDVTFYKADGSIINKFEAAMTARNIGIPGVSIYSDMTIFILIYA